MRSESDASPDRFELPLPISVNGAAFVEYDTYVSADGLGVWLLGENVQELLSSLVSDQVLTTIADHSETGLVPLEVLNLAGLEVTYDPAALSITIQVPAQLRRVQSIQLRGDPNAFEHIERAKRARWSGYSNFRVTTVQSFGGNRGLGGGIPSLNYQQVVNHGKWTFESIGSVVAGSTSPWRRGATKLVRDFPMRRIRYEMGDVTSRPVGFQDPVQVLGLNVFRENRLQPFHRAQPNAASALFLEEASTVEIIVDGQSIRTMNLPAGPYRISDFQLSGGLNDVELVVTDQYGVETRKSLSLAFDEALLAESETDYFFGAGVVPRTGFLNEGYQLSEPVLSAYTRRGISSVVTGGVNVQANRRRGQVGLEGIWAAGSGTVRGDLALSYLGGGSPGVGTRISYLHYADRRKAGGGGGQWRLDLAYHSSRFGGIESDLGALSSLDTRAAYSTALPLGIRANVGVGFQLRRGKVANGYSARASLTKRFRRGVSGHLSMTAKTEANGGLGYGFALRMEWTFGSRRQHRLTTSSDSRSRINDLRYSYVPVSPWNQWRVNADMYEGADGQMGGEVRAGYSHARGDLDVSQMMRRTGDGVNTATRVQLSSAVVFADGHWGVSRPIADSFALVVGHENLHGKTLRVNESTLGFESAKDRFGPGVVGSVQSYYPRLVTIQPPDDLPIGYDLGSAQFLVESHYRGGSIIRVGSEASLYGSGRVLDVDGKPFGLQAGELHALDREELLPETLFTSREGEFVAESLFPGRYQIRWFDDEYPPIEFRVEPDETGLVDLGVLSFGKQTNEN